jgi:hypothetical protein
MQWATGVREFTSSGTVDGTVDRDAAWSPAALWLCGRCAGLLALLGTGCWGPTTAIGVGVLQTSGEPERVGKQSLHYVRCPYALPNAGVEPLSGAASSALRVVVLGPSCVVKSIEPRVFPNRDVPWVSSPTVLENACTLQFDEGTRTINVATVVLNREGVILTGSDAATGRQVLYRFTTTESVAGSAADDSQLCADLATPGGPAAPVPSG